MSTRVSSSSGTAHPRFGRYRGGFRFIFSQLEVVRWHSSPHEDFRSRTWAPGIDISRAGRIRKYPPRCLAGFATIAVVQPGDVDYIFSGVNRDENSGTKILRMTKAESTGFQRETRLLRWDEMREEKDGI